MCGLAGSCSSLFPSPPPFPSLTFSKTLAGRSTALIGHAGMAKVTSESTTGTVVVQFAPQAAQVKSQLTTLSTLSLTATVEPSSRSSPRFPPAEPPTVSPHSNSQSLLP